MDSSKKKAVRETRSNVLQPADSYFHRALIQCIHGFTFYESSALFGRLILISQFHLLPDDRKGRERSRFECQKKRGIMQIQKESVYILWYKTDDFAPTCAHWKIMAASWKSFFKFVFCILSITQRFLVFKMISFCSNGMFIKWKLFSFKRYKNVPGTK